MTIKYYRNKQLTYAGRKRYSDISKFEPFFTEQNRKVVLGDGANTIIKTSVSNICDYVTINNTRWFVTSYTYLNGAQVQLYLQRDVIGEYALTDNGLSNWYGKIERGYTDSIIKNRRELSLNRVLKNRKYLKPTTNVYGNYTVDNHDKEIWGILHFVKPTGIDPSTGKEYESSVTVNIPAFAPLTADYPVIENGKQFKISSRAGRGLEMNITAVWTNNIGTVNGHSYYFAGVYPKSVNSWTTAKMQYAQGQSPRSDVTTVVIQLKGKVSETLAGIAVDKFLDAVGSLLSYQNNTLMPFVSQSDYPEDVYDYNGVIVKDENKFYSYSSKITYKKVTGSVNQTDIKNKILEIGSISSNTAENIVINPLEVNTTSFGFYSYNYVDYTLKQYFRTELDDYASGNIVIDTNKGIVNEPFITMVIPLYNVSVGGNGDYKVKRDNAFTVFNSIIQYLSGENPYLIDAQIYPYCPDLADVTNSINGVPIFSILSSSYNRNVDVSLLPLMDVKKEYITREYSIVSPEQSYKYDFAIYDYIKSRLPLETNNLLNSKSLTVKIKTALKPFAIISSAVIIPENGEVDNWSSENGVLAGITYESDLRGCKPSSNGFEASLSSNLFEQYKRQNSNYQQIFSLQQKELSLSQDTERVNEKVQSIVNTLTQTAFGAIAGAQMADAQIFGTSFSKPIGAVSGSLSAGAAVGSMSIWQYSQNEKLRTFEKDLQQQNFDITIGTIKNLPNSVNRISSFNELILQDFWYVIETYECTEAEQFIAQEFIDRYGYGIGVIGLLSNYYKEGWFLRSTLISSTLQVNLHNVANDELKGGVYIYE